MQLYTTSAILLTREKWSTWRKTCRSATLSAKNPIRSGQVQEPGQT